jgi:hypothetical protein
VHKISEIKVLLTVRSIHDFSTIKIIPLNYIYVRNFSTPPKKSYYLKTTTMDCYNGFRSSAWKEMFRRTWIKIKTYAEYEEEHTDIF